MRPGLSCARGCNVSADPSHASVVVEMNARLDQHARSARDPQTVHVFPLREGNGWEKEVCVRAIASGLLTPLDQEPGDQGDP